MSQPDRLLKLLHKGSTLEKKVERQLYVAAVIAAAFDEEDIRAVLVGGALVEYYTAGGYSTEDIDMVLPPVGRQEMESVMKRLGFERFEDSRHWVHPQITIPVEFPPGPLQIGHLILREVNEIEVERIRLKVLKVEDILLDRFVMALEWKDAQAEVQAEMLMYAHYQSIDWGYVHQKSSELGIQSLFQKIQKRVKRRVKKAKAMAPGEIGREKGIL